MAFKDQGEEITFLSRILGVGLILTSPIVGPFAPAFVGIGGSMISAASLGSTIANLTTRKNR